MNIYDLLNIKYRFKLIVVFLLLLFLGLIVFVGNKKICNVYKTIGYINDNHLIINIPISTPDIINNMEYLNIDNEEYTFKLVEVNGPFLDEVTLTNYEQLSLLVDNNFYENQVLNVSIYYKLEKVYEKIKSLFC